MTWINPIYDRTQGDVSGRTPKGFINYTDLNRIEGDCIYLRDALKAQGYYVTIHSKAWVMEDFPYLTEINRIRDNVMALIGGLHDLTGRPVVRYVNTLNYTDANSLERNIAIIDPLLQKMIDHLRFSGELYSGEDSI